MTPDPHATPDRAAKEASYWAGYSDDEKVDTAHAIGFREGYRAGFRAGYKDALDAMPRTDIPIGFPVKERK